MCDRITSDHALVTSYSRFYIAQRSPTLLYTYMHKYLCLLLLCNFACIAFIYCFALFRPVSAIAILPCLDLFSCLLFCPIFTLAVVSTVVTIGLP